MAGEELGLAEVTKRAGAEASVKVLNILSMGGKGEVAKGETNRVKVVLNPLGVSGRPFEVASEQTGRPDARGIGAGS